MDSTSDMHCLVANADARSNRRIEWLLLKYSTLYMVVVRAHERERKEEKKTHMHAYIALDTQVHVSTRLKDRIVCSVELCIVYSTWYSLYFVAFFLTNEWTNMIHGKVWSCFFAWFDSLLAQNTGERKGKLIGLQSRHFWGGWNYS